MISLFRPLLIALLCITLAAGPVPAWLHVVTCNEHGVASRTEGCAVEPAVHGCCSHCHHASEQLRGCDHAVTTDEEKSGEVPGHDSEHCSICQSLLLPGGLIGEYLVTISAEALSPIYSPEYSHSIEGELLGISQPRGPPLYATSVNS